MGTGCVRGCHGYALLAGNQILKSKPLFLGSKIERIQVFHSCNTVSVYFHFNIISCIRDREGAKEKRGGARSQGWLDARNHVASTALLSGP